MVGRALDLDRLAGGEAVDEAPRGEPRPHRRVAGHALRAVGPEVAVLGGEEEGHLAQAEGGTDAVEQALGGALEVEVGVEVLGEADEGLPRGVPLAIREPVERLHDAGLHRGEEQDHDERGEEGHERRVRLLPQHVGEADRQEGEADDHRHRQHVAEAAAEHQLDVHQAVLDDRVGERERDEGERAVAHELHREPRLAAEGEGQRVEREEREDAGGRAPHEPLHLPPRDDAAGAPVRAEEHREGQREDDTEVERLHAVDGLGDAPQRPGLLAAGHQRVAHRRRAGDDESRHVERGNEPQAARAQPALGEAQAEVQVDDRQEQAGEVVGPEEGPVGGVQPPGVRDRVHQEEEHADGVEVQGDPVGRAAQHHDRPDDQAEEAGQREVVEGAGVALAQRLDGHRQRAPLFLAEERVLEPLARPPGGQGRREPLGAQDLLAVDREEHVARPHAGPRAGAAGGDAGRHEALGRGAPEHPVVHEAERRLRRDVVRAERREGQPGEHDDRILGPAQVHGRRP